MGKCFSRTVPWIPESLNGSEALTKYNQSNSLTRQIHQMGLWDKPSRRCTACLRSHGSSLDSHETLVGSAESCTSPAPSEAVLLSPLVTEGSKSRYFPGLGIISWAGARWQSSAAPGAWGWLCCRTRLTVHSRRAWRLWRSGLSAEPGVFFLNLQFYSVIS